MQDAPAKGNSPRRSTQAQLAETGPGQHYDWTQGIRMTIGPARLKVTVFCLLHFLSSLSDDLQLTGYSCGTRNSSPGGGFGERRSTRGGQFLLFSPSKTEWAVKLVSLYVVEAEIDNQYKRERQAQWFWPEAIYLSRVHPELQQRQGDPRERARLLRRRQRRPESRSPLQIHVKTRPDLLSPTDSSPLRVQTGRNQRERGAGARLRDESDVVQPVRSGLRERQGRATVLFSWVTEISSLLTLFTWLCLARAQSKNTFGRAVTGL
ncbi:unnamed protein product [Arctogadus glacialis]